MKLIELNDCKTYNHVIDHLLFWRCLFNLSKKGVYSIFIFSFRETHYYKTCLILYLYSVFIFSFQKNRICFEKKKKNLNTKTEYNFLVYSFSWKWIQWIFVKKPNMWVPLTLIYPIKKHTLSQLCWIFNWKI